MVQREVKEWRLISKVLQISLLSLCVTSLSCGVAVPSSTVNACAMSMEKLSLSSGKGMTYPLPVHPPSPFLPLSTFLNLSTFLVIFWLFV